MADEFVGTFAEAVRALKVGDPEQRDTQIGSMERENLCPHRFRNASETEPVKIFWVYGLTEASRTFVESGETRSIAAERSRNA